MADYYPLLARALDALPDRSPALRKAVYDRARSALIAQLRSLDPPVPEADIELERLSLDAAIGRLEVAYGGPAPAAAAPEPSKAAPAAPEAAGTRATTEAPAKPSKPEPEPPSSEKAPAPPVPTQQPKVARETAPEPAPPPADPVLPLPEPTGPDALPEAGPPPDFVPFVPPPRKPKRDAAPAPPLADGAAPPVAEEAAKEPPAAVPPPNPAVASRRPRIDVVKPRKGRSRLLRNAVVGGILVVVIGLIAVAAFMLRDKPSELTQGGETDGSQNEQADSKFADRVGNAESERRNPAGAKPQPEVTVAQHAILYDENTADPRATPKATQGRVVWRLEPVSGEQGQPLQSAVRATVDYPDAGFSLTMTIRKNLDATLPASHTVELAFNGQGDERSVQEVGLPQLKDEQTGRGAPLSGLPVRVRDNLFLIGLSNLPADIERNTELLTKKNWIDLGVRFKAGPRAVLSFDKGTAGTQVMQSAFDQWMP